MTHYLAYLRTTGQLDRGMTNDEMGFWTICGLLALSVVVLIVDVIVNRR